MEHIKVRMHPQIFEKPKNSLQTNNLAYSGKRAINKEKKFYKTEPDGTGWWHTKEIGQPGANIMKLFTAMP